MLSILSPTLAPPWTRSSQRRACGEQPAQVIVWLIDRLDPLDRLGQFLQGEMLARGVSAPERCRPGKRLLRQVVRVRVDHGRRSGL